ncbi:hypothetical protein SEA_TINABELCHER_34 [Streptomyces phage TinaBelcher]|uniref:Uncharacterized protein n=1 Tax=Streptomyces phage Thestral TaxID=2301715 RepID=A0A385E308_9CAUD|nr:hypothetical protein KGG90_gp51 [Streptomyces phage Thestral]AXQ62359.1 hypothetical protein SEA_TRVXSCOTT_33 [Streptomyces phage TrvxScott]AXQ65232.1 hypothetical protein SEA_THESTRAL_35 [Streptomyces phage Thestral]QAY15857.1 hypothetical protein SEA_TINABELCHER_34 [Streptomyces phage TinaBelcher]
MALNLIDIPVQGGGWFKPKDNINAVAILLEVHQFERQRPTPNGPKDSVLADVTIFQDAASLQAGTPQVTKGQRIEQTILARDLETIVGGATIVRLEQVPPKKPGAHPAWVWRPITDAAVRNAVIGYAEKREKEAEAALADVPDFD